MKVEKDDKLALGRTRGGWGGGWAVSLLGISQYC